ncbi:MAG TPA: aspartyl protease family protein [Steroidobacteraceae bacterium]|nr:aspartyl protease family protein [Steroidobacteraceae bacterium]
MERFIRAPGKLLAACLLSLLLPLVASAGGECRVVRFAEFPVTMSGTRPLIAGSINGVDALFMADSGAFFSVISHERAESYKLLMGTLPSGLVVSGIGGTAGASLGTARSFTLAGFSGHVFHNVNFVVLDDSAAPALVGQNGAASAAAVLGQNVLGLGDVEYDLANGYIRLFKPENCADHMLAYWHGDKPVGVIKIAHINPVWTHLVGTATLDGSKINVMFDSGATRSMLALKAARRAGFKPDNPDVTAAGISVGIGRRRIESWIARFDSLDLGGEEVKNARLRVSDIDLANGVDMLLGADFFLSHRLYVANSQGRIFFTYNGGRVFDLGVADQGQTRTAQQSDQAPATTSADTDASNPSAGQSEGGGTTSSSSATGTDAAQSGSEGAPANGSLDAASLRRRGAASAGRLDYRAALADFDEAIRLEPNDAENYLQRATARAHEHETALALSDYDQALRISPDNLSALLGRGELRLADRNESGARADFERASAIAATDPGPSLHIAEIYATTGHFTEAIALYDRWMAAHPADSRLAAAASGRCWARAATGKDLELALADCQLSVRRGGATSYTLQHRGLVWLRLGRFDEAIADYKASLKLQPRDPTARYGLGLAERGKGMQAQGDRDIEAAKSESASVAALFKRIGLGS